MLAEAKQTEARLETGQETFAGPLRATATLDLGQQHVAQVLSKFVDGHPDVTPCLHLTDGVVNLVEEGFDLGILCGVLSDSTMVARKLMDSHRLCYAHHLNLWNTAAFHQGPLRWPSTIFWRWSAQQSC